MAADRESYEVVQAGPFAAWLARLRDTPARNLIVQRIERMRFGHFGDAKFFAGIGELRIRRGPGYRVYFIVQTDRVIVLLCGGDKGAQPRDIARAMELAREHRNAS